MIRQEVEIDEQEAQHSALADHLPCRRRDAFSNSNVEMRTATASLVDFVGCFMLSAVYWRTVFRTEPGMRFAIGMSTVTVLYVEFVGCFMCSARSRTPNFEAQDKKNPHVFLG